MATVYITEYAGTGFVVGNVTNDGTAFRVSAAAPEEPEQASQTVAVTGSNVASAAFGPRTYMVRIHTDSICSIKFGTTPVATATSRRLAANQTEYFCVQPNMKVGVITNV